MLFVNPEITQDVLGAVTVQVIGPANATPLLFSAVTKYEVGVAPAPAVTVMVAFAFPATAEIVGALSGVVAETRFEFTPSLPLNARITTGNVVPLARPVTIKGEVLCAGDGVIQFEPPSNEYW